MDRPTLLGAVERALDGRQLVWFGTRGDDIDSIAQLGGFTAAFSIIARYDRRHSVESHALEDLTGHRVDLDAYDIDDEVDHAAMAEFRRHALRILSARSAVFTYRPSALVSALCFARRDRARYLGMFKDHQAAFEHKPWVESSLSDQQLPAVPWTYVADEDQLETLHFLDDGPVVLRRSRTSGGAGLIRVEDRRDLPGHWPDEPEAYVSVAPYIEDGVPINVGAVVWKDGITLHPASVQLIGTAGCTSRPFGFCGNDFSAIASMDDRILDEVEASTRRVGEWLRAHGFLGAFGVDYLVKDGLPLFIEVNPRFQGSTHLSCQISVEMGESCILLDHLGASLGLPAPVSRPLARLAEHSERAHLVVHWTGQDSDAVDGSLLAEQLQADSRVLRLDLLLPEGMVVDHGAAICRVTTRGGLTTTGYDLDERIGASIRRWRNAVGLDEDTVSAGRSASPRRCQITRAEVGA